MHRRGHAALRSHGLPAHTWAICALSAGYRIHDRAARNRQGGAMRGALTFAVRDMNRVGMTATAARWVLRRGFQTGKSLLVRPQPGVL